MHHRSSVDTMTQTELH